MQARSSYPEAPGAFDIQFRGVTEEQLRQAALAIEKVWRESGTPMFSGKHGFVLNPKLESAQSSIKEPTAAIQNVTADVLPPKSADVIRLDDDDGGEPRFQLSVDGKRYIATMLPDDIIMWDEVTQDGEKEVTRTGVKRRLGHLLRTALKKRKAAAAAGGMQ